MVAALKTLKPGLLARSPAAAVTLFGPCARFSVRARRDAVPAVSTALCIDFPRRIGERGWTDTTEALCLGPDEWVINAPESESGRITEACDGIFPNTPHSLTDISDRELTVGITGSCAAELLTLGCPRDIDCIAPGSARRTIFDGATVVLWRDAEQEFRMDVWRSFAPHVFALLETGCTELATG